MEIHNCYFQRSPVLDLNWIHYTYSNVGIDEIINACRNDLSIMERILVASESLYEALQKKEVTYQAKMACMKYILRMSARAMPFGLFAGVTKTRFTSETMEKEQKIVELSMEWMEKVTQVIEQEQQIDSGLIIVKNSMLRETSDSYYIDVATGDKDKRLYFRKSSFFVELLRLLEQPRTVKSVITHFSEDSPGNEQTIVDTIKKLLHNKCLISSLRPSSIKRDTNLSYLLEKRDLYTDNTYDELKKIDGLIHMYKERRIGDGIGIFQELLATMKKLCPSKSYVVVDLVVEQHEREEISKEMIEQVIRKVDFLEGVNYLSFYHLIWDKYRLEFLDRYGLYNEVNVLDLVDPDVGIGMPSLTEYKDAFMTEMQGAYDHFLIATIQRALVNNKSVVQLKEIDIEYIKKITGYNRRKKSKQGFDVKLSFIHENGKQKLVLTENAFGMTPFSFTGRLNYPTERDSHDKMSDTIINAELNVIPNKYKDLGVTYISSQAQINIHAFPCEGGVNISIEDLVVGMDEEGFYLKSKALHKKVFPISTHKLFYSNFNEDKPLLFLSQLGNYVCEKPADFSLGKLRDAPYIPRIEYEDIVLSLRRWNLTKKEMKARNITEEEYIRQFVLDYKVDMLVNILVGDMILPVKIDTVLGMELIVTEFKKEMIEKLTLVEAPELQNEKKMFNSDYIFTVIPTMSIDGGKMMLQGLYDEPTLYDLNWVYYSIYYRKGRRVNTSHLIAELLRKHDIEQFFFVNYIDKEEHIRVRIKIDEAGLNEQIEQELKVLVQDGCIKKFSKHNYLPEYSRYGGRELIDEVHQLFVLDTAFSLDFSYMREYAVFNEKEKGIFICIHTIMDMFNTYEQAMNFMTKLIPTKNKEVFKGFTSNRKKYVNVAKQSLHMYSIDFPVIKEKRNTYRTFVGKLDHFTEERKFYLLQSLLHMAMNRVVGVDREVEREAYELAKYTLHNLKYPLEILGEYDDYL